MDPFCLVWLNSCVVAGCEHATDWVWGRGPALMSPGLIGPGVVSWGPGLGFDEHGITIRESERGCG